MPACRQEAPWQRAGGALEVFHLATRALGRSRVHSADLNRAAGDSGQGSASRAGHVLLAGLPNAGKSTLLNALVGESISIVTAKAQTTWQQVAGIRTEADAQMVFVDTPGFVAGEGFFDRSMASELEDARIGADVAIAVLDGARPFSGREWREVVGFVGKLRCPVIVAANKADHSGFQRGRVKEAERRLGRRVVAVSAKKARGLGPLLEYVRSELPASPFLYPRDDVAVAPVRFFVQEFIREAVFSRYRQEIPYSVAVRVEEFRERQDPVYVSAAVYVERKSQKGIVVGQGGAGIKALGRDARHRIEHFLGRRVYLDLWVKVWHGWRRKKEGLAAFGYKVPDDGA